VCGGGVVFALTDVQAEEGADVTGVDRAGPSNTLSSGRASAPSCRTSTAKDQHGRRSPRPVT
jgi:hypothetical protein